MAEQRRRGIRSAATDFARGAVRKAGSGLRKSEPLPEERLQVVIVLSNVIETITPYTDLVFGLCTSAWQAIEPYHPEDAGPLLYGFLLTFFGGVFMTLIAAIEAAHLFGWEKIQRATGRLCKEWRAARRAFDRDNRIDSDHDGVADVDELDAAALARRRFVVLTRSVDPEALSMAFEGLASAYLAILATLRVRFAAAITLGTAIGDTLNKIFGPWITAALKGALPDDHERWGPVLTRYLTRYVGVCMSWILMRVTASVFSAIRGSAILVAGVCSVMKHRGAGRELTLESGDPLLVFAWGGVALLGFYWQASSGFRLSFPLNIILLPVTIVEKFLVGAVGTSNIQA